MKTELLETMGDDLMVANAARVSFGKRKTTFDAKDQNLLEFLSREGHTSPFRHPQLQFRIQCPIYIERQLFKHQVGATANSISGRYVDFSDTYDLPIQLRRQSSDSKQGSAEDLPPKLNAALTAHMSDHVEQSKDLYRLLVDSGGIQRAGKDHPSPLPRDYFHLDHEPVLLHSLVQTPAETRCTARDSRGCGIHAWRSLLLWEIHQVTESVWLMSDKPSALKLDPARVESRKRLEQMHPADRFRAMFGLPPLKPEPAECEPPEETEGTRIARENRALCNNLTKEERAALLEEGLRMVNGSPKKP